jgi:long-chain fatty acid transport protein
MKRITTLLLLAGAMTASAWAGGLLHNTNQSIHFVRMMARGASHEIDGVYTNPAGLAFMDHEGWTLSLNIQSASQRRDVLTSFPLFPAENNPRLYKGKAEAPVVPSLYGAYKRDRWTFSGFFGFTGGGGKCSFDSGLPVFDASIMAGIYGQTAALAKTLASDPTTAPIMNDPRVAGMLPLMPNNYEINSAMKGRQYIYGIQLGATYRILDWMSAYVGGRMNYFDGNYNGYVKVLPKPELASAVQQIAVAYPALAPTLSTLTNQNGEIANIELDCNQTGWGITPIIGVDLVWKGFTLAAKYEFKTKLNIENDTKKAIAEPAAFEAALADYKHGVNTPNDLPAVLYTALGYEFIPNKLRATIEYHYYDDKHAHMAKDKQNALKHGTHEVLAGVEWDINKTFTVSCGAQNTDYGLSDAYQTHTSFSCDSYSIGLGGAVNLSEKIKLNVGYFWTTYKDYKRDENDYFGTTMPGSDTYSRTNKVFGAGIDFKF